MNAARLERRRRQAESHWKSLQTSPRPVIYVGMGACGLAAGAGDVLAAIEGFLEARA